MGTGIGCHICCTRGALHKGAPKRIRGAKIWPPLCLPNHERSGLCLPGEGGAHFSNLLKGTNELIVALSAYFFSSRAGTIIS